MRKGFWGKFDEMMNSLPEYIDEEMKSVEKSITTVGSNNVVSVSGNTSIKQSSKFGSSSSTIVQGGNKIVITTKNKKTTIKVNGKEWAEKNDSKE